MGRTCDNRGSRIAATRLEQDIGLDSNRTELLGDEEAVLMIGHDDWSPEHFRVADAADRLLKRRTWSEQTQKLFRQPLS